MLTAKNNSIKVGSNRRDKYTYTKCCFYSANILTTETRVSAKEILSNNSTIFRYVSICLKNPLVNEVAILQFYNFVIPFIISSSDK